MSTLNIQEPPQPASSNSAIKSPVAPPGTANPQPQVNNFGRNKNLQQNILNLIYVKFTLKITRIDCSKSRHCFCGCVTKFRFIILIGILCN